MCRIFLVRPRVFNGSIVLDIHQDCGVLSHVCRLQGALRAGILVQGLRSSRLTSETHVDRSGRVKTPGPHSSTQDHAIVLFVDGLISTILPICQKVSQFGCSGADGAEFLSRNKPIGNAESADEHHSES